MQEPPLGPAKVDNQPTQDEQLFRLVWDVAGDAMVLSDPDGRVIAANPAYCRLYGYSLDELVGQDFNIIFPPEQRAWSAEAYRETFDSPTIGPTLESVVRRKDGSTRMVEATYSFLTEDSRRTAMLSQVRDVTENRLDRARVEAERARVSTILQTAAEGIYGLDMDGNCTFINPATLQLLGYEEAECLGRNMHELTHYKHPDGSPYPESECPIYRALHEGVSTLGADEVLWHRDGSSRPVLYSCSPMFEDGRVVGGVVTIVDISQLRRAEEERAALLAQEQQARDLAEQALRALEQLLSVVSHDLRSPITVIQTAVQLLQRQLTKGNPPQLPELQNKLAMIATAAERMDSFIEDLSSSRHPRPGGLLSFSPGRADLEALARRVAESYQQRTDRHLLVVETGATELVGYWDGSRLEQVLDNLLSNAVKYSPKGGVVTIHLGRESQDGADWAALRVQDQGLGIPAADLPHVFDWYRRGANVKDAIAGTGIGLAGTRQIIEQHGGQMTVESQEGMGTTFTVLLPLPKHPQPALT